MLDQLTSRKTLYAAFDHVREKGGCRGVDGVSVEQSHEFLEIEIDHLQDRLIRRRYHPLPLLQFQVPKSGAKLRSLSVPTVRDRVVQTAVHRLTREIFEAEFEDCSYAFREGRSVKDAVHRIDELRRQGFRWVVDADIEGFFDHIDHEKLLARLRRLSLEGIDLPPLRPPQARADPAPLSTASGSPDLSRAEAPRPRKPRIEAAGRCE